MNKDIKALLRDLDRQGFTHRLCKTGSYQIRDAEGRVVAMLAANMKRPASLSNALSHLRRAGYRG